MSVALVFVTCSFAAPDRASTLAELMQGSTSMSVLDFWNAEFGRGYAL